MRSEIFLFSPVLFRSSLACLHRYDSHVVPIAPERYTRRWPPSPLGKTAIKNIRVFDGDVMSPPQTIIIDQEEISHCPDGVTNTIDGSGRFLIPGLIDSHVHFATLADLEETTSYGVTSAMQMACRNYTLCALLRNHVGLADFRTAGVPAVGKNSSHSKNGGGLDPEFVLNSTSKPLELVKWAIGNESDYYKIAVETNGPSQEFQIELVGAAHAFGIQTMSHAADVTSYLQAIKSRSDGIQHTADDGILTSSAFSDIKRHGQYVTPTMTIHRLGLTNPAVMAFLRGHTEPGNSSMANVLANVRAMYQAGIPILAGTDSVGTVAPNISLPFGISLHHELQNLVEIGMTPAEAINAATRVAAKYHRLGARGIIAPGMRADLVMLKSNPLVNITNTLDIEHIWVGGRLYAKVAKAGIT